jgi:hypothetical protein
MNSKLFYAMVVVVSLASSLMEAQVTVTPSPDRPGQPGGENVGAYNVTDSFEAGYRFVELGGDQNFFRSNEDYSNGIRLFSSSFTANSKDGHGPLFDSISATSEGLGNDPYESAAAHIEKNGLYRYDMTWRSSDYFNQTLANAGGDTLKNTRRVIQDHDLGISLTKWAVLKLGYSRNHETGPEYSVYELYIGGLARDVLPIDRDARRDWNEYRLGTELNFLGFRLTLQHHWDFYKDDSPYASLVPGEPYVLGNLLNQSLQPSLPATYPNLATAYSRSTPMRVTTPGWFGNLYRSQKLWAIDARITYNKADQSSIYNEVERGASAVANSACSNCGVGKKATASTNMLGTAREPFTAGDVVLSVFPTSRLTITNSTSAENVQYDGSGQMLQLSTVAATKNVFWLQQIDEKRVSDALDLNYRVTKWLGLNSEYRYTDRLLDNNLIRTGTTKSRDINSLSDHLNSGTFGFRLNPIKPLSINLDGTIGRTTLPETPIAPAHFHNIRGRVQYRMKHMNLSATYRQVYNLNAPAPVVFTSQFGPPPLSYFASHSRDYSFAASFPVRDTFWLDVSYSKTHLDTLANLWLEEPVKPKSSTIVSVPGYLSEYISNLHSVSILAKAAVTKRVALYAGYSFTHDSGDGRGVQNLGIQDPAGSVLANTQTFPLTYQAPLARVSLKLTPRVQWNGGWQLYRYNQQFAFYNYQPYYRAQTGYSSLSFTF